MSIATQKKLRLATKIELGGHFSPIFEAGQYFPKLDSISPDSWHFPAAPSCSRRARKGGLGDAPMTTDRFLTPNSIAFDKLPWFAKLLVTFGGCFALHNSSGVCGWVDGNMQFGPFFEQKSLLAPRAEERAPGRPHDTRTVPNPE